MQMPIRAIVLQVLDELVVNDIIALLNRKRRKEAIKGYVFYYSSVADGEKHEEECGERDTHEYQRENVGFLKFVMEKSDTEIIKAHKSRQ